MSLLRSAEVQYSDSKEPLLCAYELSAVNADKPSLPESELIQRLEKVAEVAGSDALVVGIWSKYIDDLCPFFLVSFFFCE